MNETNRSLLGRPADPNRPGMSPDDAEALLAINMHVRSPSPEWVEFLGETISTWLVEQRAPAGVMDDTKSHWLLTRIDEGGASSPAALALLRQCCVKARAVPAALLAYLRQQEMQIRLADSEAIMTENDERRMTGGVTGA